jgi:hypothetical protein
MTIHWCGTGLSSIPGLRRLIEAGHPVTVWNRTVEKARAEVGDLTQDVRAFSMDALAAALKPGDIAVSMLPADQHVGIAKLCLEKGANFCSSSYIAPEMRDLDGAFREKGLVSVNEVGLDPGIDHLMAHDLVARYRASKAYHNDNVLSFTSYCGGVPKVANAFRYKFSWAPAGVLKALRSPSRSLRHFTELRVARPWDAISRYDAPLPQPESFEVYPNRDSYPFMDEYRFEKHWKVKDFVRGTIRLNGWADAWAPIFREAPGRDQRRPRSPGSGASEGQLLFRRRAGPGGPVRVPEGRTRWQAGVPRDLGDGCLGRCARDGNGAAGVGPGVAGDRGSADARDPGGRAWRAARSEAFGAVAGPCRAPGAGHAAHRSPGIAPPCFAFGLSSPEDSAA